MAERARPDLASAMYPALARETKAREAAQQRELAQRRAADYRAQLYREINARADERLAREREGQR
jgi:hypothetical protein